MHIIRGKWYLMKFVHKLEVKIFIFMATNWDINIDNSDKLYGYMAAVFLCVLMQLK